jgi:hypothetical protein
MMSRQPALCLFALLIAVAPGLTGCASGGSGTASPAGAGMSTTSGQMMAGMSMAPGQTMAGMSMAPGQTMAGMATSPAADEPSEAAKMVCSKDLQNKVMLALKLATPAPVHASWQHQRYTCTYSLPMGKMVLSVNQFRTRTLARNYFNALRLRSGNTQPLAGLGESAYGSSTGIAVVLKDNMSLQVDTTGLPAVFGAQQQRRTDLAYEIASDVLGCWTGDE